jgi:hypothetical protein
MDSHYEWEVDAADFLPWNMRSSSPPDFDPTIWVTTDGRKCKITQMDQRHLENALAYCKRMHRAPWYYASLEKEVRRRKKLEKSGKIEIRYCTYGE